MPLEQQRNAARSSVTEVDQRQENAEAAIMRAEAAVEMARLNLSYTVVLAPCDGYLGRRSIEEWAARERRTDANDPHPGHTEMDCRQL